MNSSVAAAVPAANSSAKHNKQVTCLPVQRVKVGMISLGCAKNLVDAEIMLGSVLQRGMEITSRADDADVLVVNTCAFIDSAKEESIEAILEAHQQRGLNKRPDQKLIVSGCMSQRFARELRNELPEVDAFIGLDQVNQLGAIVEKVGNATVHGQHQRDASSLNVGSFCWTVETHASCVYATRGPRTSRITTHRASDLLRPISLT